jgi:spore germination protein KA
MFWRRHKKPSKQSSSPKAADQIIEENKKQTISNNMDTTITFFKTLFAENDDFSVRRFDIFGKYPAVILYFSNVVNKSSINSDILKPLMYIPSHLEKRNIEKEQLMDVLLDDALYHSEGKLENKISKLVEALMRGATVVLVDGVEQAIVVGTFSVETRGVEQPQTEQSLRGAREGYVESLGTNIALLRYRLPTPNFRIKTMHIGRLTKSKVAVCYIEGIVNSALVEEVMNRLAAIDLDGIIDAGYLEQFIEDHNMSPFPQVQNTERPDKTVASMLEGRVAILVDGSPFALIVPAVFSQFYQTLDDYTERFLMGSLVRMVRVVALMFSLLTSSLYVSVISYNPELMPTDFAAAVAGGRAGVPFPAVIEVLLMEISMEILREATLRLPQQVGGALSIVGVLVVGQAAVSAGFVSPITVVIIALTTIGSFATPAYNAAIALRMLRFPLILFAGFFGLYGVMVGFILVMNHVVSLKSFGVPYMSPLVPGNFQGMKDTVIRAPLWWMPRRPTQLHTPNENRLGSSTNEIKQPASNTLDPLKVGNERWDAADGSSVSDNRNSSNSDSD